MENIAACSAFQWSRVPCHPAGYCFSLANRWESRYAQPARCSRRRRGSRKSPVRRCLHLRTQQQGQARALAPVHVAVVRESECLRAQHGQARLHVGDGLCYSSHRQYHDLRSLGMALLHCLHCLAKSGISLRWCVQHSIYVCSRQAYSVSSWYGNDRRHALPACASSAHQES